MIFQPKSLTIHSHPIVNCTNPLRQTPQNSEGEVLSSCNLGSVLVARSVVGIVEFCDGMRDIIGFTLYRYIREWVR